jgi:hypothetical protein
MTDALIKSVAIDIITITSMWALLNNPYMANVYHFNFSYHENLNYSPAFSTMLGIGVSTIVLIKYL